ncbi:capsid assembly scaffolding protein Gp46 family protein [Heyndrickxia oleronia]|jgi:hypothetical protein|uniref:capsid assembly scaffolding protein Gp46 family protein n=1 Tax=Heyndrickxia oleronia TaxID=38875 RepID=UPI00242D9010|nr:DUF4355 domain-containing protein [Heyndrickxia oleronia]MCI1590380.1 DUF4355 domain-containing protein [Heyndrickxia oleronia]MCI1611358.1 DUF4355 domain-containing protein [Heyndrickxia oleronia]MCI1742801.1 DUF4355 domain-containing protein [Heyndrickxia oleronia]MCI1763114.1 DUF4355 domain-containing protein [Heyndrickxia oleronia]
MDLAKVKEFIEANKESDEVKEYLQGFVKEPSVDEILGKFESDESLKKWLESEKDKHFAKGLSTFKEKTMPKLIEDEIAKRNPSNKSPEQLKVEEALKEIERWKTKTIREAVKNEALKFSTDNKLPSEIIEFFITLEKEDDEEGTKSKESTMSNLTKLKEVWANHLQQSVTERMKSNGFTPKDGDGTPKTLTLEQLKAMSTDEIAKLDQSLVNEALKNG